MENKKSNKGLVITIIILIIIILGLGSYIVYDKFIKKEDPKKVEEKDTKTESFLEDETKAIVYQNPNYTYLKVPYINIKTSLGTKLNKEIKDFVDNNKYIDSKEATNDAKVDYKISKNGDIVSVIILGTTPGSTMYYKAININEKTGAEVTNKELLEKKGIKESELSSKLLEVYENQLNETGSLESTKNNYIQSGESISIYDANKNIFNTTKLDDFDMYLNDSKELIVVVKTYLFAGPDSNLYRFNLDTKLYEK